MVKSDRIEKIIKISDDILSGIADCERRSYALEHANSAAQNCALLAEERGLDAELSFIIGLLHDLYYAKTGIWDNHAINSAEYIRPILRDTRLFKDTEKQIILQAVMFHSEKDSRQSDYAKLVKDSHKLSGEPDTHPSADECEKGGAQSTLDIDLFIYNAKKLASMNIEGKRESKEFIDIIKYFPEDSAFDELKNGWCAAFVYHCLFISGLRLPIKIPGENGALTGNRLAGVYPFKQWALSNDFYINHDTLQKPILGDIVVYDNIIPPQNKQAGGWDTDHIGIVVDIDGENLIVAEGNVDNENVSGIVIRDSNKNIDGYIRVPQNYYYM
jgi:hypothetical protein